MDNELLQKKIKDENLDFLNLEKVSHMYYTMTHGGRRVCHTQMFRIDDDVDKFIKEKPITKTRGGDRS